MAEQTSLLALPYIMPSQAQKHVTHNEALRMLDALLHIHVEAVGVDAPPGNPSEGERHVVGDAPEGAFAGHVGEIACWQDGAWTFYAPRSGWLVWDAAGNALMAFDAVAWIRVFETQDIPFLGVNAAADAVNRLAVAASATLLTHEGAGHQLKINKAAAGDTASLLFQDGWSGRAEMGLAGNDDFSLKVSPDGAAWQTALRVERATGRVGIGVEAPQTPLDVAGIVRSAAGFRVGNAILQNGVNSSQLNTSAHFSTTGLFAVGTTPINNYSLRIALPDADAAHRAIYAYTKVPGTTDGLPLFVVLGDARTGIGTLEPEASAALDVVSASRGFLPPRMTTTQRDAIAAPAEGLTVYNTTEHEPQFWNGSAWVGVA